MSVCVRESVCVTACVWVCVCVWLRVCECVCVCVLSNNKEWEGEKRKSARACFAWKARLAANQSAGASLCDSTIESITGWPGGAGSIWLWLGTRREARRDRPKTRDGLSAPRPTLPRDAAGNPPPSPSGPTTPPRLLRLPRAPARFGVPAEASPGVVRRPPGWVAPSIASSAASSPTSPARSAAMRAPRTRPPCPSLPSLTWVTTALPSTTTTRASPTARP